MANDNREQAAATVLVGDQVKRFALVSIECGLKLQVKTGMGFSGNRVVVAAKRVLTNAGIKPKRTHKALLEQFTAYRATIEEAVKKAAELKLAAPNN